MLCREKGIILVVLGLGLKILCLTIRKTRKNENKRNFNETMNI